MPYGNLRANKIILKSDTATRNDVVMDVLGDTFSISMNNLPLMTVVPDWVVPANTSTITHTPATFHNNVVVNSNLVVGGSVHTDKLIIGGVDFTNVDIAAAVVANNKWLADNGTNNFNTTIFNIQKEGVLAKNVNKTIYGRTDNGSLYSMVVPPNFTGTVAMYSHGYRYPYAMPNIDLFGYSNVIYLPQDGPLENSSREESYLHAQGVATIGAGYTVQGWNRNLAVETNHQLLSRFKELYPQTNKVVVWGDSLGSHITQAFAETYPDLVDAVGLFDYAYNLAPEFNTAFDVLWSLKQVFDYNDIIMLSGFSTDIPTVSSQVETILGFLIPTIESIVQHPITWPEPKTIIGTALSSNGIPPIAALHVIGAMCGIPNRSPHFGGAYNTSNISLNLYPFATIENTLYSSALSVNVLADLELQLGGSAANNSNTVYSNRLGRFDLEQFNYIVPFLTSGGTPTTFVNTVLNTLDNLGTKVAGPCNIKLTDGTLGVNYSRINKPTVAIISEADPITPIGGVRQMFIDYNSNVSVGLATSNMLQVLISPAPTTPYFGFDFTVPAALGTGHGNFTPNNYILGAALMLYGANTNTLLTGTKLVDGIRYTENMIDGSRSNVILSYPPMNYYIEHP